MSSLEDLEVELGISSAEIETKIEELEKGGLFSGITVDDARGGRSFVRASVEEMRTIASFINDKGRLTVEELTVEADRVLQLSDSREESYKGQDMKGGKNDEGRYGGVVEQDHRGETISACENSAGVEASGVRRDEDVGRLGCTDAGVLASSTVNSR